MKCDKPTKTMVGYWGFIKCDGEVKEYYLKKGGETLQVMRLCEACLGAVKRAIAILNIFPLEGSPQGDFSISEKKM